MGKTLGALRAEQKGSAAVEFALIAPLFFALVFSIMEAGWFFFVNSAVEQANANASRLIRTGQAQTSIDAGGAQIYTKDAFFSEICNVVSAFGDCEKRLTVDIARFANFDALANDISNPVCRDRDDPTIQGAQFSESDYGTQNEIIRVRVCFLYKPLNPAIGLNMGTDSHGFKEVVALSIFRNEPFES